MKVITLTIGFAALLLFSSCENKAKTSFNQVSQEITAAGFTDLNIDQLQRFVNKIDTHLSEYPSYEKNAELSSLKETLISKIDDLVYNEVSNKIKLIENESFEDYDQASNAYSSVKQALQEYIDHGNNKQNIENAKQIIEKIDEQLNNINTEQSDFYAVVASNDAASIEDFLSKYPNSVMSNTLLEKIDQIYYSEFISEINSSPNSIYELNNNVSKAKSYLTKFRSVEAKNKIGELIANMESQRRTILDSELSDGLQDLIERMEDAARQKAEDTRPTYNVEMCSARGSNPEVVGNSSIVERIYQVNMKGAFMGWDKRELMIRVTGRIKGDIQNGVSINITGTRIETDKKL